VKNIYIRSASIAVMKHYVNKWLWTCDSASSAVAKRFVLYVFIHLRCAESVCLYYGLRFCGQKYIIIISCSSLNSCVEVGDLPDLAV